MTTELFTAVQQACVDKIEIILSRGADVNSTNLNGDTALHVAIQKSSGVQVVECLLDNGADISLTNKYGETAFQMLLNDLDDNDENGLELLRLFMNARADVNTVGDEGQSVLHFVCKYEHSTTVNIVLDLISWGAEVNAKDSSNQTPLHIAACKFGDGDTRVIEVLLSAGADANAVNDKGRTPAFHLLEEYVEDSDNDNDYDDESELDVCSLKDTTQFFEVFKKYKADFKVKDFEGKTMLHYACQCGTNLPAIKFLLKNGLNINDLDNAGMSPLLYSLEPSTQYSEDLVNYLLKQKPDVNVITPKGYHVLSTPFAKIHWKTIIKYIAELHEQKSYLHVNILKTITENRHFKQYFQECTKKIQSANQSKNQPGSSKLPKSQKRNLKSKPIINKKLKLT